MKIRTRARDTEFVATALSAVMSPSSQRPRIDAAGGRACFPGCDAAQVAAAPHRTGFGDAELRGLEAVDGVGAA